ncbi:MAG: hypothetical protein AOA65_2204 [Candidatus Bathyarchaeota archaeon BA1]|nr:MAG: hypothetical protein AOA65_2204 [Candidatus Bathyarchaeota archaeon BA1]
MSMAIRVSNFGVPLDSHLLKAKKERTNVMAERKADTAKTQRIFNFYQPSYVEREHL